MTKWISIAVAVGILVAVLFVWRLVTLGKQSQTQEPMGGRTESGALKVCSQDMRCVSSVDASAPGAIAPLPRTAADADQALADVKEAVFQLGGEIAEESTGYFRAEFTSQRFGFVDDLEIQVPPSGPVHVRSESRVGKSDMGVNRKRVESLRQALSPS